MLISENIKMPALGKVNAKELKVTLEFVKNVIHNVITNSITEMNNLLYAGMYVVAEWLSKMKNNKSNENLREPWWKRRIQANIAK